LINVAEKIGKTGKTEETDNEIDALIEKFNDYKKRMSELPCAENPSQFISSCDREIRELNQRRRTPKK
jgi:hypothetical protein